MTSNSTMCPFPSKTVTKDNSHTVRLATEFVDVCKRKSNVGWQENGNTWKIFQKIVAQGPNKSEIRVRKVELQCAELSPKNHFHCFCPFYHSFCLFRWFLGLLSAIMTTRGFRKTRATVSTKVVVSCGLKVMSWHGSAGRRGRGVSQKHRRYPLGPC